MSTKPTVVFTRLTGWEQHGSEKLNLVYVPVTGDAPKRKGGRLAGDAAQAKATGTGITQLVATLKKLKPQVLVRWVHTGLTLKSLVRIREASPHTRIMVGEGNGPAGVVRYMTKFREHVDVALINSHDPETIKAYRKAGIPVDTLWDGYRPEWFPKERAAPKYDCFFAGSNRRLKIVEGCGTEWRYDFPGGKFRYEFLKVMNKTFGLRLYGRPHEWPFKCMSTLYHPAYWEMFQTCKLALGCNHYDLHRYYTRRLFHSGGSGRLFITKYIPGMEVDFQNHENIVWFRTIGEGIKIVGRYLKDDPERERIAKNQERLFREQHSWKGRLKDLEKVVQKFL